MDARSTDGRSREAMTGKWSDGAKSRVRFLSSADKIRWSNDKVQGVFVNVGWNSDVLNKIGIREEL